MSILSYNFKAEEKKKKKKKGTDSSDVGQELGKRKVSYNTRD
jgi:hypothetical protein